MAGRSSVKTIDLVIALAMLCLGAGLWVVTQPNRPTAVPTSQIRPPTQAKKHFPKTVHFDLLAKLLADDRHSSPAEDWLKELADPKAAVRVNTQTHSLLEHPSPSFTLEDHRGQPWSLRDRLRMGPVVLVFYLGYSCNACVHDLFELNADLERFHELGAEVVAVSGDLPSFTRQRFEQFGAFGFPVLSDPGHDVALSYGTFRPTKVSGPEELLHGTFLIGRDGKVHWVHYGDAPFCNNKGLLYELARLENKLPIFAESTKP
jgi:peroxiredoxin